MAGSMGLAVNNSRAVFEGLLSRKSEFVRTPKFKLVDNNDDWSKKKYVSRKIDLSTIVELTMAIYYLVGICSSIYFLEIAALPFQMLFFIGFASISFISLRTVYSKK
jgi:hypothetical protein